MPGPVYLLSAALLWSTAGAAIKLSSLDAWQLSAGRSLVAAVTLWVLLPAARRLPSRQGWLVALAYAATVTCFVSATKLTTAANAIFLQSTAPLWVVLLSAWWLREKPSRGALLALPVFAVGLSLFFVDELGQGAELGNVLALVSGVAFACSIVGLRAGPEQAQAVLVAGNVLATVVAAPLALRGVAPTTLDLGTVAFLGVFQLGLSYVLLARGLEKTPALEASLFTLVEPELNPVWTFLLAGERPGPYALAGAGVVLAGVVWLSVLAAWDSRAVAAPST